MKKNYNWYRLIMTVGTIILLSGCQNQKVKTKHFINRAQQVGENNQKVLLDVPLIAQNPELSNGCEVTSLAMLLQYEGIDVDKMTLADKVKKDSTPVAYNVAGEIVEWGNPEKGFVGDITGENIGYGVYTAPIIELMSSYLPDRVIDLSNQSVESLQQSIDIGKPVTVWVTGDFNPPNEPKQWQCNGETIEATFDEHVVLLVGYDDQSVYVNNPLSEEKNQMVDKEKFIKAWDSMGNRAVSYV